MNHDIQDPIVRQARRRVALKTGWLIHASVFALVNLGLWALGQTGGGTPSHFYPLWGWGLGLCVHGLIVLVRLQGDGLRNRWVNAEVEGLRGREGSAPRG